MTLAQSSDILTDDSDERWGHVAQAVVELLRRNARGDPPAFGKLTIELDMANGRVQSGRLTTMAVDRFKPSE
ncbi:MAG: hypothetical protein GX605_08420 [Chloroflexi bacterium]|nr:hypothetical protein [Chloroflexota bacterium]